MPMTPTINGKTALPIYQAIGDEIAALRKALTDAQNPPTSASLTAVRTVMARLLDAHTARQDREFNTQFSRFIDALEAYTVHQDDARRTIARTLDLVQRAVELMSEGRYEDAQALLKLD
jgi:hypothetical protein